MTWAQLNLIEKLVEEHGVVKLTCKLRGKNTAERYRIITADTCKFRFAGRLNKIYGPGWNKSCFIDKTGPYSLFNVLLNMKEYDGKARQVTKVEVL